MVSRVLKAPDHNQTRVLHSDPALAERGRYLTAVNGAYNTPWGTSVNKTCGLHMHVGLGPKLSGAGVLPLDVLQHLSYMLVQFETSISTLHSRGRRALADTIHAAGSMLGSNLLGLRQARHVCDKTPMPILEEIQDRLFSEDISIEELAILMSATMKGWLRQANGYVDRHKLVNFRRLVGRPADNGARTIEFRHLDGSLEAEEVGRWLMFVTRLVRAAERMAARSKPATPEAPTVMTRQLALKSHMTLSFARKQGNKYKLKCQKQTDEYERLFNLMEMPRLDRDYWMGKYKLYNPEEVVSEDELLYITQDDCPVCVEEAIEPAVMGSPVTLTRSPALGRIPEEPTTPRVNISFEETERLRVIWGIRRSVPSDGSSGDGGNENEPPYRPNNEQTTTNKDFFDEEVTKLRDKQRALRLSDRESRSSSNGKRRRAGGDGLSSKRRCS